MKEVVTSFLKMFLKKSKTGEDLALAVDVPRKKSFGDYSSNLALLLAKKLKQNPKTVAEDLKAFITAQDQKKFFAKVEVAGPGFVNFTLAERYIQNQVLSILKSDKNYGRTKLRKSTKVLLEFVSANPTGPLHVGHGRWAVLGDDLARILKAVGYQVHKEFYVNDAGRQIELLRESVNAVLEDTAIPADGYRGAYIREIADHLRSKGDPKKLKARVIKHILDLQKKTLASLGVIFDSWFSEKSLHAKKIIQKTAKLLTDRGVTYVAEGALWFRSTDFGDDKDRVLVRENGQPTYFLADIAYHLNKFKRGYDLLIDVWGTDHHGYVKRVKSAVSALGYEESKLEIIIGQLVSLYRAGEQVRMSKRTGQMITLKEVIEEIGVDATRYYFAMNDVHTHLDFDLEKAKEKSMDNPVYYLQYAHARLASIQREAKKQRRKIKSKKDIYLLTGKDDRALLKLLLDYPDELQVAARLRQPHRLLNYAKELATFFHSYYHRNRVISDDRELTSARLIIVAATRIVIRNILGLLGIAAPEKM